MGGKQAFQAHAVRLVVEEQLLHLVRALEAGPALDLAQGRDHGVGVLGQLHRPRVGDIFTGAREHHADHDRQGEADGGEGQADQDQGHGVLVVAPAAGAGNRAGPGRSVRR